ncbi:MAG: nuclease-related domain-containing protein [Armatimonadota bacterium]
MLKKRPAKRSPLKDKPLNLPGESLERQQSDLLEDKVFPLAMVALFAIVMAAIEWWRWYAQIPPSPVSYTLLAAIVSVIFWYRWRKVLPEAKALWLGVQGERLVGQELEELRSHGCQVYHDLEGDGFNLDHVVVSRRGIVVIDTKTLRKPADRDATITFDGERILVDGREPDRDYLVQAAAARRWLRNLLRESTGRDFPIRSAIVFPGWFVQNQALKRNAEVWVFNHKALLKFIPNEPEVLLPSDVALVSHRIKLHIRDQAAKRT